MEKPTVEFSDAVVDAIASAIKVNECQLHAPSFAGSEELFLRDCLRSTFVSTAGEYTRRFERDLKDLTGAQFVVAVNTGTAGLYLALKACGIGAGDEVLVPSLSFVATANAVTYTGAKPHFLDIEPMHLGIDPDKARDWLSSIVRRESGTSINKKTGRTIKAIVPMHTFGHPCQMEKILALGNEFRIKVVEDAAESIGSYFGSKHTGTLGDVGVFSFNGNKIITCGAGGAVVTNNKSVGDTVRHLANVGKVRTEYSFSHDIIGYNLAMPAINAALGCGQLERLDEFLIDKRRLLSNYLQAFGAIGGCKVMEEPQSSISNYWLHSLILDSNNATHRDDILHLANKRGFQLRPVWDPIHTLPPYLEAPKSDLSCSEMMAKRVINLPSGFGLC